MRGKIFEEFEGRIKAGNSLMVPSLAAHAWSLLSNGEAAKGKLVLETLLHASPDDVQASLLLAHACIELGCSEEAVATARLARICCLRLDELSPRFLSLGTPPLRHAYAVKCQPAQCALGLAVAMGTLARQPQVPDRTKQEHRCVVSRTRKPMCPAALPDVHTHKVKQCLVIGRRHAPMHACAGRM